MLRLRLTMRCGIIRRMRRFRRLVPFRLGGVLRLRGPGITPSRRPVARLSRGIGVFIPALLGAGLLLLLRGNLLKRQAFAPGQRSSTDWNASP